MPIFSSISQSVNDPNANVAAEVIGLESQNKLVNAISKYYQYYLHDLHDTWYMIHDTWYSQK